MLDEAAAELLAGRLRPGSTFVEVVDGGRHLDARHAVDRGVMDLGDQREAARRQPFDIVEPLDAPDASADVCTLPPGSY